MSVPPTKLPVAIVGGGLAGLVAARRLHQAKIRFVLLEARTRLGGRILSADASGQATQDGFDLGPSWVWPAMQPAIGSLIEELRLPVFAQHGDGDMVFERSLAEGAQRYGGMMQQPPSIRIAGGTGALATAIAAALPADSIHLNARVQEIALKASDVVLTLADGKTIAAAHVILALPPRLLEAAIAFAPALPPTIAALWRDTPTWMAPHAKFFAVYTHAFWRDKGLSGDAQSMVGPLVEIHDATTASGMPALFGFLGVPAAQRASVPREAIIQACVAQLARLFGPEAANPRATLYKDWSADPLTSTALDQVGGEHPIANPLPWINREWANHITLAGSETAIADPGYLSGAVEAGERAAAKIIAALAP